VLNSRDVISQYWPRESFQTIQDYDSLESILIFNLKAKDEFSDAARQIKQKAEKSYSESSYLSNQVFRKTYVQIKRSIDEWLRVKNLSKLAISTVQEKAPEGRSPAITS